MADGKKALLMVLGKPEEESTTEDAGAGDTGGEAGSGEYDDDLKTALDDLATALGVSVKDPEMGVEALKTIHDLCARASGGG